MPVRLEKLYLKSFRGFEDFYLECSQVTVLVGPNSCGKTTVLQAIQFLNDVISDSLDRAVQSGKDNGVEGNPSAIINSLNPCDPDAFWPQKNCSEVCSIAANFSNNVSVHIEVQPNRYQVQVLLNDMPIRDLPDPGQTASLVRELKEFRTLMVPPPGASSSKENKEYYPVYSQQVKNGQAPRLWRNGLYWLYNDGRKEHFEQVVDFVGGYLDGTRILPPRETHDHPARVEILFEENGATYDIGAAGGGLHALLNLGVVLIMGESTCMLLDEPDAHLHSRLQRAIARMLLDHAEQNNVQLFVSTHAPDFVSEIPTDSLVWVDRSRREGTKCDAHSILLADLGAASPLDALAASNSHHILFLEGKMDREGLARLFASSAGKNPFTDQAILKAKLPDGKGNRKHLAVLLSLLKQVDPSAKIACITDRDYELQQESEDNPDGPLLITLDMKEIENYLLNPEALAAAANNDMKRQLAYSQTELPVPNADDFAARLNIILEEIVTSSNLKYQYMNRYMEQMGSELDRSDKLRRAEEEFVRVSGDTEWQLRHCPGKEVLKRLREWCKDTYNLNISTRSLIENLGDCPPDIQTTAEKIAEYFYGATS